MIVALSFASLHSTAVLQNRQAELVSCAQRFRVGEVRREAIITQKWGSICVIMLSSNEQRCCLVGALNVVGIEGRDISLGDRGNSGEDEGAEHSLFPAVYHDATLDRRRIVLVIEQQLSTTAGELRSHNSTYKSVS